MQYQILPAFCQKHYMCKVYICTHQNCTSNPIHCYYCNKQLHKNCKTANLNDIGDIVETLIKQKLAPIKDFKFELQTIQVFVQKRKQLIRSEHSKIIEQVTTFLQNKRKNYEQELDVIKREFETKKQKIFRNNKLVRNKLQALNYFQNIDAKQINIKFSVSTKDQIQSLKKKINLIQKIAQQQYKLAKQQYKCRQSTQDKIHYIQQTNQVFKQILKQKNKEQKKMYIPSLEFLPLFNNEGKQNTKINTEPKLCSQRNKKCQSVNKTREHKASLPPSPRPKLKMM